MNKKARLIVPDISVILPVYNSEKYLDESISSILNQTFKNIELIIINDGSKDNSLKIIKKYADKDKRIKLINNSKNIGLAASLNKAIEKSQGKYIARMDADDVSFPERLKIQFNYLESNLDVFLCSGSAIIIDENGQEIGKQIPPKVASQLLPIQNYFIHPSYLFRNQGIKYRDKFFRAEDYDFLLRLLSEKKKMITLDEILLKYRMNPTGSTFCNTSRHLYYVSLAKYFYYLRRETGKDNYDGFDFNEPQKQSLKQENKFYDKKVLEIMIKNKKINEAKKYFYSNLKFGSISIKSWVFLYIAVNFPILIKPTRYLYFNIMKKIQKS